MDAAVALMILLSCTAEAGDCRETRGTERFETMAACREALPPVLRRLKMSGRDVMGRCELVAADHPEGVDPIVTGSIPDRSQPMEAAEETTINVTRFIEGRLVTDVHRVPTVR